MSTGNLRARVFALVDAERARQDARFGVDNHPDVRPDFTGHSPAGMATYYGIPTSAEAKEMRRLGGVYDNCTWTDIALEEFAEVVEAATLAQRGEGPEEAVDEELVQLAAVVVAWLEARARRGKVGAK